MGPLIKHWVIRSNPNPNYNSFPLDVSVWLKLPIRFRMEVFAGRLIYYKMSKDVDHFLPTNRAGAKRSVSQFTYSCTILFVLFKYK